jgi:hypothetical protein
MHEVMSRACIAAGNEPARNQLGFGVEGNPCVGFSRSKSFLDFQTVPLAGFDFGFHLVNISLIVVCQAEDGVGQPIFEGWIVLELLE